MFQTEVTEKNKTYTLCQTHFFLCEYNAHSQTCTLNTRQWSLNITSSHIKNKERLDCVSIELKTISFVRFQVLTVAAIKITVLCDVTQCSLV
jgi:hypothetical protein